MLHTAFHMHFHGWKIVHPINISSEYIPYGITGKHSSKLQKKETYAVLYNIIIYFKRNKNLAYQIFYLDGQMV